MTVSAILDNVPWWVWFIVVGGGGGAAIAFIPGAFALAVSVWNSLPKWLRATILGLVTLGAAYLMGRNKGARNAREQQARDNARAKAMRKEIDDEVARLNRPAVDKRLDRWMRD